MHDPCACFPVCWLRGRLSPGAHLQAAAFPPFQTPHHPPVLLPSPQGRLLRCLSSSKSSGSPRHPRSQRGGRAALHSSSSLGSTGHSPHQRQRRQQLDLMQAHQQRAGSRLAVGSPGGSDSALSPGGTGGDAGVAGSAEESGEGSGSDAGGGGSSHLSGMVVWSCRAVGAAGARPWLAWRQQSLGGRASRSNESNQPVPAYC